MNNWKKIKRDKLGELPKEPSQNLQAPEIAPKGFEKEKSKKLRPLGLKVSEEFFKKIKLLAAEKDLFLAEIIEQAVNEYQNKSLISDKELMKELERRIKLGKILFNGKDLVKKDDSGIFIELKKSTG